MTTTGAEFDDPAPESDRTEVPGKVSPRSPVSSIGSRHLGARHFSSWWFPQSPTCAGRGLRGRQLFLGFEGHRVDGPRARHFKCHVELGTVRRSVPARPSIHHPDRGALSRETRNVPKKFGFYPAGDTDGRSRLPRKTLQRAIGYIFLPVIVRESRAQAPDLRPNSAREGLAAWWPRIERGFRPEDEQVQGEHHRQCADDDVGGKSTLSENRAGHRQRLASNPGRSGI